MTTILLVEDAHELAQVIVRELETTGYHVLHAADGIAALHVHAAEQPALVIPGLDAAQIGWFRSFAAFAAISFHARVDADGTGRGDRPRGGA